MASNTVPSDKLGAGIGFFAVGQSLAFAIGPSVGLILVDAIGYTKTFYSGAVVILIGVFSLLFINIQEKTKKEPLKLKLNNMFAKEATVPMLIITFITMASINVSTFIVLFAQSRNIANIGLYFTVNAILALVTRPLVSAVSDRVGVRKMLFVALLFGALYMVLISISRSLPMILAAAVCSALGPQISQPSIQVLCIKSVSPERRGIGGSTNYLGWDIGGLIGPLLAGYFVDLVGYANMFLVLLVPCLLAILTYCVFYRRIKEIDTRTYTKAA